MMDSKAIETPPKPDKPPNQGKRWAAEDDARLAAALNELQGSFTARFHLIAEMLGRSKGSVESRAQLLDLLDYGRYNTIISAEHDEEAFPNDRQGEAWTQEETGRLLIAHEIGDDFATLAKDIGRTPRACALKLVQLGKVVPTLKANPQANIAYKTPKAKAPPKLIAPAAPAGSMKIKVTPEFQTAMQSILDGENLLILGSAGTGKSTFLRWMKKNLNEHKRKYAVLAPTGMAGVNIQAQTIHSFFSFKPQLQVNTPIPKARYPKLIESLDLIVVDEISMVRADVFDAMDKFLRKHKNGKKPFGGVQMVLMGDLCQLPPVVRNEEADVFQTTYPHPFFFATPAWELGHFHTIRFTHIFRQSEENFINLLNAIRHGRADNATLKALNARVSNKPDDGSVVLASRNRTVDGINANELAKLPPPARTYVADTMGDLKDKEFTTPAHLTLKVGAKVMFTRNDKMERWVNGTLGHVVKMDDETIQVRTEKGIMYVEREKWESTRYAPDANGTPQATVAGHFVQFPLTLAWALTIHKAQGQTLPKCTIDLSDGGTFAEGQLYVALSRATSLESLTLTQPIQPWHVKTHPAVMAFYERLGAP